MFFIGAVLFLGVDILADHHGGNRRFRCSNPVLVYVKARANKQRSGTHVLARCTGDTAEILLDPVRLLCFRLSDFVRDFEFARSH